MPGDKVIIIDLIWKYYELHVVHRRTWLNFLLIGSSFLMTATAIAWKYEIFIITSLTSLAGFIIAILFWLLDRLTQKKIIKAKEKLIEAIQATGVHQYEVSLVQATLEQQEQKNWYESDKTVSGYI